LNKRILLTGGSGFVGRAALKSFLGRGDAVRAALRRNIELEGAEIFVVGDLDEHIDWRVALEDIDTVVHLAARVHQLRDRSADPLAAYRRTNTEATLRLADQAASAGVKRFVYLSTAKVYGENSPQHSLREKDTPAPQDAYALSKWKAEQGLQRIAAEGGMEFCILRPPLVYGPGVGANFLRLMDHVARRKWLPLGAVRNRRTLLSLQNLVAAIHLAVTHPEAAGETFNVADDEALSTPELIRRLAAALGIEPRLDELPPNLLRIALRFLGRGAEAERLLGDFVLDNAHLKERLSWQPMSIESGLQETAHWYRSRRHLD
jgi:nucleoside-diphosphate-sugar epimerase